MPRLTLAALLLLQQATAIHRLSSRVEVRSTAESLDASLAHDASAAGAAGAVAAPRPHIVHFMFELMDHFPMPSVWARFFQDAPQDKYRAWAHCKYHHACEQDGIFPLLKIKLVSTVYSRRGVDLVTPYVHMIRYAMAATSHLEGVSEKFVVISDSTLPVKPFHVVHSDLASTTTSDICFSTPGQWATVAYDGATLLLPKHHQWLALNRSDAELLSREWTPVSRLRAYAVPLKSGKWANNTVYLNRSIWSGGTWYTATDEEAIYAKLFGPLVVQNGENVQDKMWKLFLTRKCGTYVAFPMDVQPTTQSSTPPVSLLEMGAEAQIYPVDLTLKLIKDPETHLAESPGIMHPYVINTLGDKSLAALRSSSYNFARKFSSCSYMVNYTDLVLKQ